MHERAGGPAGIEVDDFREVKLARAGQRHRLETVHDPLFLPSCLRGFVWDKNARDATSKATGRADLQGGHFPHPPGGFPFRHPHPLVFPNKA